MSNQPNDNDVVEVDGLRFETLVPQKTLIVPQRSIWRKLLCLFDCLPIPYVYLSPGIKVTVGFRITNNTSIPLRFNFHCFLIPELVEGNCQIEWNGGCIRPEPDELSNFPLVIPGEQVEFFADATLCWFNGHQFRFDIAEKDGFFWSSEALKFSTYKIRFKYQNYKQQFLTYAPLTQSEILVENFWIGEVDTPWKDITLVKNQQFISEETF